MNVQSKIPSPSAFPDWVVIAWQLATYILTVIPFRLFARARRQIPENIRALGGGSLLIANHQAMVDPFVIVMHVPFYAFLRMLPIRFPTLHKIFTHPLFNPRLFPFLTLFGCYSIGTTSQEKMLALFYTRQLLQKGYAVFLFPEGQINKEKNVQELQKGIEFFKNVAHNVIFVRTHGFHEEKNLSFLFQKRSITFGDVLPVPFTMSLEEMRQYLDTL